MNWKVLAMIAFLSAVSLALPAQSWNVTWGGADTDWGWDLTNGSSDDIYVAGYTENFGEGAGDALLVRFDKNGVQLSNHTWGGADMDEAFGIAIDASGNIHIVGYTWSFGEGNGDAFIVKYDSDYNQLWNHTWGGAETDFATAVAVDASGNAYVTGQQYSFGSDGMGFFLTKYDSDGSSLWNVTFDRSGGGESGTDLLVGSDGYIYVTGWTSFFGIGNPSAFLMKYDSDGNQIWNTSWAWDEGDTTQGQGIAIDSLGYLYVGGDFGGMAPYAFLVKYDSDGNQVWNRTWGGGSGEYVGGTAVDPSDDIYLAGHTYSFGAGSTDAFVVKYDSDGNLLWNGTWGGTDSEYERGITSDSVGNISITGHTFSFGAGAEDLFVVKYIDDSVPPSVGSISPDTAVQGIATNFNATVSDNMGVASCGFYWNDSLIGAMSLLSGNNTLGVWNYSYAPIDNGTQYAWANCSDAGSNTAKTNTTITVNASEGGAGGTSGVGVAAAPEGGVVLVAALFALAFALFAARRR